VDRRSIVLGNAHRAVRPQPFHSNAEGLSAATAVTLMLFGDARSFVGTIVREVAGSQG
jgi:hypothetical protein